MHWIVLVLLVLAAPRLGEEKAKPAGSTEENCIAAGPVLATELLSATVIVAVVPALALAGPDKVRVCAKAAQVKTRDRTSFTVNP